MSRKREELGNGERVCRRRSIFSYAALSRLFLCSVFSVCSVVHSYGQNEAPLVIDQDLIDWLPKAASLERKISNGTTEEKRDALFQIRNLQTERASRIALPALRDQDEIVRATAASSVVFLSKNEAANSILPLLNDRAPFVRREAAFALGAVGSTSATSPLIRIFQHDKDLEVRAAAAMALGKIGDPIAIEPLLSYLEKRKPTEDEEFLRRAAVRSIGQIAQVVSSGRHRVVTPQDFLPDKYKELGEPRGEDLMQQFPIFKTAPAALNKVLQNTREAVDTRREAAFSLGAIGNAGSTSILEAQRNGPDPFLAEIAKEALLKIAKRSNEPSNKQL